jgi:hypothetical protein
MLQRAVYNMHSIGECETLLELGLHLPRMPAKCFLIYAERAANRMRSLRAGAAQNGGKHRKRKPGKCFGLAFHAPCKQM